MSDRKVTPEQQKAKERLAAAREELKAALDGHECFLISEVSAECWVCGKPYINGKFPAGAQYVRAQVPVKISQLPEPKPCRCEKDADGECNPCKAQISEQLGGFTGIATRSIADFRGIMKKSSSLCNACQRRYMDWGLANVFKSVFGQFGSKEIAQEIAVNLVKVFQSMGIGGMPLTEKAWADLQREKGWL